MTQHIGPTYSVPAGHIQNADGEMIPPDEPLFLLRASDPTAIVALEHYAMRAANRRAPAGQLADVHQAIADFHRYQDQIRAEVKDMHAPALVTPGRSGGSRNGEGHQEA